MRVKKLGSSNKVGRLLWRTVWITVFRPTPRWFHAWRRGLLRIFGAKVGRGTYIYPSVQVWAPWNLEIGDHCCLSHYVDCYCVDKIILGHHVTISQYSHLCNASHDYNHPDLPLITAPIIIHDYAWVMAGVFVGPAVTIGEGAVVGARSTVIRDIEPWTIVAGVPARFIGRRDQQAYLRFHF